MDELRIRTAGPGDGLVVAALVLQCALHRGGTPEPGFLDRYAAAWAVASLTRPVWLAEAGDEHAGFLQAVVVEALPFPGRRTGGRLLVETFFVRPAHRGRSVGEHLLRAAVDWARDLGLDELAMTAGPHTRPMVERVGLVADPSAHRLELA